MHPSEQGVESFLFLNQILMITLRVIKEPETCFKLSLSGSILSDKASMFLREIVK